MKNDLFPAAALIAMIVAGWLFVPAAAHAQILFTTEASDGYVRDGLTLPKDGDGDQAVSAASLLQILHTTPEDFPFEDRGILEFDITSVTTVEQAQLRIFTQSSMGPYPLNLHIHTYEGDNQVTTADFAKGDFFKTIVFNEQSELRIDVTAVLQQAVADEWQSIGFNLRTDASAITPNGPYMAFYTREASIPSQLLFNDHVPEPASIALLLSTIGLLTYRRSR